MRNWRSSKRSGEVMETGSFKCRRCGNCCRIEGFVRLTEANVGEIASYLHLTEADFIERYTDLAADRQSLVLKDGRGNACIMLDGSGGCSIYPVRPRMCRTFPHEWVNADSAAYCPALAEIAAR